jgi:hypothetical protein
VDDHACGFVDGEDVVIFVEDFERDVFGFGLNRGARLGCYGDFFTATQAMGGFYMLTVDEDGGGIDEFLDAGTGEVGAVGGDDAVEALIGVVGGGYEIVSH